MESTIEKTTTADLDLPEASEPRPHSGMVWIPGGTFRMGSDHHYAEEAPAHDVTVDGFWIDRTPVTNGQFARFVRETEYTTFAEYAPTIEDYPDALPEMLRAGSLVFKQPPGPVDLRNMYAWWDFTFGADWRHPEGLGTDINDKNDHPVVHVAYRDIKAYAKWAGKEIPTEAEWEFAARGGLADAEYAWGGEFNPGGKPAANTWQGQFPWSNLVEDGYERTSPVGSYPPNGYSLVDMIGNVWEWTSDWYQSRHGDKPKGCCNVANPRGAALEASFDPCQPSLKIPRKVLKGGSYLCAPNYCRRYRPAARHPEPIDTSSNHIGFRCIVRPRRAQEAKGKRQNG